MKMSYADLPASMGSRGPRRDGACQTTRWRARSLKRQPVNIRRRFREQRGLLGLAIGRGDALEGVEDHLIAALALVGRKVAFEHAAFGAERLDAGFDIGTPRRCGVFRRRRHRALVKVITEQPHRQSAEL